MADNFRRDDAEKFLLHFCRTDVLKRQRVPDNGYEIWIPEVVAAYFRGINRLDSIEQSTSHPIWKAFFDAAWELSRRGILRPNKLLAFGRGAPLYTNADGYSLTSAGREWLARTTDAWFPTDAGRYISALTKASHLCGGAFTQRAQEAARCYEAQNNLACCAMCGAAAESVMLALASARTDDPDGTLATYLTASGRSRVFSRIAGQAPEHLRDGVKLGFDLLKYWRDAAAHGHAASITEMESYLALYTLFRFATFAVDNWKGLTGKVARK